MLRPMRVVCHRSRSSDGACETRVADAAQGRRWGGGWDGPDAARGGLRPRGVMGGGTVGGWRGGEGWRRACDGRCRAMSGRRPRSCRDPRGGSGGARGEQGGRVGGVRDRARPAPRDGSERFEKRARPASAQVALGQASKLCAVKFDAARHEIKIRSRRAARDPPPAPGRAARAPRARAMEVISQLRAPDGEWHQDDDAYLDGYEVRLPACGDDA